MHRIRQTLVIASLCGLLATALSIGASSEQPEWLGVRYLATAAANASDGCDDQPDLICVEWCDVFQGPTTVPRGILCCVEPSEVGEMVAGVPCLDRAN